MINTYYVYAWFNKETDEIFYIGMGHGTRAFNHAHQFRTKKFMEYYNSHDCDVMFLAVNLSQEEALEEETEFISYYRALGQCCCNITIDGKAGAGIGKDNPNYGNGQALRKTYQERPELKELTKHKGGNNGRAIKCELCDLLGNQIAKFDCMKDCYLMLKELGVTKANETSGINAVSAAIKSGKPYKGYIIKKASD